MNYQKFQLRLRRMHTRGARKKVSKGMFFIHQCIDTKVFEKIVDATLARKPAIFFINVMVGDVQVKRVRL